MATELPDDHAGLASFEANRLHDPYHLKTDASRPESEALLRTSRATWISNGASQWLMPRIEIANAVLVTAT